MRILAVDDEQLSLNVLKTAIEEACPTAHVYGFSKVDDVISFAKDCVCDIAFLDIRMKTMTGIELAKQLKEVNPRVNIVFVTGYSDYMADAFSMHVSGYVLKPASKEKIQQELEQLRHPVQEEMPHVMIQTFGNFEIFVDGDAVLFSRAKAKELLAYLVDRNGAAATTAEIAAVLWEDREYNRSLQHQTQTVISALTKALREKNIEEVITKKWNSIAVNKGTFQCDLYDYLDGKLKGINAYHGEYMSNYSWAEYMTGWITKKYEKK